MEWVEDHVEETLTVYRLPREHRLRMKSTNMLERYNEELRRAHACRPDLPERGVLSAHACRPDLPERGVLSASDLGTCGGDL